MLIWLIVAGTKHRGERILKERLKGRDDSGSNIILALTGSHPWLVPGRQEGGMDAANKLPVFWHEVNYSGRS